MERVVGGTAEAVEVARALAAVARAGAARAAAGARAAMEEVTAAMVVMAAAMAADGGGGGNGGGDGGGGDGGGGDGAGDVGGGESDDCSPLVITAALVICRCAAHAVRCRPSSRWRWLDPNANGECSRADGRAAARPSLEKRQVWL